MIFNIILNFSNEEIGIANTDLDEENILNAVDNCPLVSNPNQEDRNNASVGAACDNHSIQPRISVLMAQLEIIHVVLTVDLMRHIPTETLGGIGAELNDSRG